MRVPTLEYFEWQRGVLSIEDSPPESPSHGDSYLIGTGTDAWAGHDNKIALYDTSGWVYIAPVKGMFCFIKDIDKLYYYVTSWEEFNPGGGGNQCVLYSAVGTTDISRNSTSFATMTDMSITQTVPACQVHVSFSAEIRSYLGSAYQSEIAIAIDSTRKILVRLGGTADLPVAMSWGESLSAGSHTIAVQWRVSNSSGYVYQDGATYRRHLTVLVVPD